MAGPKLLLTKDGEKFFIKDSSRDYDNQYGRLLKNDLEQKPGTVITSNTGVSFVVIDPTFIDRFEKIKRAPQIITLKDIGLIIAETGINRESSVVDGGAGSGALCCMLANVCGEVTSYEIRDDFFAVANKNKEMLGLKNLQVKKGDLYMGIDEKDVDAITLDLPEPWKVLPHAAKSLKIGGWIVSYSPTVPQMMDFVEGLLGNKEFVHIKTVELIQRDWDVDGRKVRPKTTQIVHTGFLTFGRRVC